MTNQESLIILLLLIETAQFLALIWIMNSSPRKPRKKKVTLSEKILYNTVSTLLNHCKDTKDKEGTMLIAAFGKHLYDRKIA